MKTVNINLGDRSYAIKISSGLLGKGEELLPWIRGNQVFIVTNEVVAPLYLEKVKRALSGKDISEIILADGEQTKSLQTTEKIFDQMLAIPLDRSATVIALGGGVIGDMAGFAAACYQRGVPFIQIPTTLLSQVDSSVGGKTAVNHARGKNMIGAFYQPQLVIADTSTLATLDARQFSSGIAEVIKYGMINDAGFFQWLEKNINAVMQQNTQALEYVIEQSCSNKAKIVEQDERESGIRALLNLGHTFGHAIETATGYSKWLHGEAIALGLVMAAYMSWTQGWISEQDVQRVIALLSKAGLSVEPVDDVSADELKSLMRLDKKVQAGKVRLVLLKSIGEASITSDYDESALDATLKRYATG
ncbi:3-dehydroquinate synthase [Candidatus Spongiihabitans sp.]|uniref:3-dehydroquinate synthase n=1 Tax=Candidatus Spongiihabitans sp. TaxID=3101308 RepID=UPI003C6F6E5E